ncbi:MAG: PD40 domain-containing protein [Planctomycetes bacterium]|nr:PD40 domain-containing protein [Planctomycetota bacterium]
MTTSISPATHPSQTVRSLAPCARALPILHAAAALALLAASSTAQTSATLRASVASDGRGANGPSLNAALSADGRWVAFDSYADDLVPSDALDTNGQRDVFLHDLRHGRTILVSRTPSGRSGAGASRAPSLSADGRFVAFESFASDLVTGDTNGKLDVFVFDRVARTTVLASRAWNQTLGHGASSSPRISADGRWVAFTCAADDLVNDDDNAVADVFVRDLLSNTTRRASLAFDGAQAIDASAVDALSADGRYVVFSSAAWNLVASDENGASDVFVRDLVLGTTVLASRGANGSQGNAGSQHASISADGRYVAFQSAATNLVAELPLAPFDVYVRDLELGTTVRASVATDGTNANGACDRPCLSADGRTVVFEGWASSLVPGVSGAHLDVYVRSLDLGTTILASRCYDGAPSSAFSAHGALSSDGTRVAFYSGAEDLVVGDANLQTDVFVRDLGAFVPTIASYCTSATSALGCKGVISAAGVPSALAGSGFEVRVDGVEGGRMGMIVFGFTGPEAVPFGADGSTWCVNEPVQRTRLQSTGGTPSACNGALSVDWNQFVQTPAGLARGPLFGTETVWAQAWIRDPKSELGAVLSDALWFTVGP